MKLLHSLPYTKDGKTIPVGMMNVPMPLVSYLKTCLLAGQKETEITITPELNSSNTMRVDLRVFDVVGVAVYADGDNKVVKLFKE